MQEFRGGLTSLCNMMGLRHKEKWDTEFLSLHPEYAQGGAIWISVKKVLAGVRAHLNDNTLPLPSDEDSKLFIFVIKALRNACHSGWQSATQQTYADGTDACRLMERFVTMNKDTGGAANAWLNESSVWLSARETFGGIFHQSGTFDFADGMTESSDSTYASFADSATATGPWSAGNLHVVLNQSIDTTSLLAPYVVQIRDLIDKVAGIPGPGGTTSLPDPIFKSSGSFLEVCCVHHLSFLVVR